MKAHHYKRNLLQVHVIEDHNQTEILTQKQSALLIHADRKIDKMCSYSFRLRTCGLTTYTVSTHQIHMTATIHNSSTVHEKYLVTMI